MFPLTEGVRPPNETLFIPTLSVIVAVNVIVSVFCADEVKATVLELADKLLMLGATLSVLITVIDVVDVELFPAASVAVAVNVSVVEPNE